jgi:hypothetical protein
MNLKGICHYVNRGTLPVLVYSDWEKLRKNPEGQPVPGCNSNSVPPEFESRALRPRQLVVGSCEHENEPQDPQTQIFLVTWATATQVVRSPFGLGSPEVTKQTIQTWSHTELSYFISASTPSALPTLCVRVGVCVCVWERERERGGGPSEATKLLPVTQQGNTNSRRTPKDSTHACWYTLRIDRSLSGWNIIKVVKRSIEPNKFSKRVEVWMYDDICN